MATSFFQAMSPARDIYVPPIDVAGKKFFPLYNAEDPGV